MRYIVFDLEWISVCVCAARVYLQSSKYVSKKYTNKPFVWKWWFAYKLHTMHVYDGRKTGRWRRLAPEYIKHFIRNSFGVRSQITHSQQYVGRYAHTQTEHRLTGMRLYNNNNTKQYTHTMYPLWLFEKNFSQISLYSLAFAVAVLTHTRTGKQQQKLRKHIQQISSLRS